MNVTLALDTSKLEWRGSNELARRSEVYRARPCLRVFGKMLPVGPWMVVVEVVHEMRDDTPIAALGER